MGQGERNKRGTWVQVLWHLSDLAAIAGGFAVGYWARFLSPLTRWIPPDKGIPPVSQYLVAAAATALVWIPLFHASGLYRMEMGRPRHRFSEILRAQALGILAVAALSFFYRNATFSRLAVPITWLSTLLLTAAGRSAVQALVRRLPLLQPVRFAMVGTGPLAVRLARRLADSPYPHRCEGFFAEPGGKREDAGGIDAAHGAHGVHGAHAMPAAPVTTDVSLAFLSPDSRCAVEPLLDAAALPPAEMATPLLGSVSRLGEEGATRGLGLVVLAASNASVGTVQEIHARCQELDLDFLFVPDLFSLWGRRVRVEEIDGLPLLRLRGPALSGWGGIVKRSLDLVGSVLLLAILSPLLLGLALAVRLESPGPIFHRQERVGRDRRTFRMVKFRSMRADAEAATGPVWAAREDPRRTRLGTFLRRWSLDELPQLWNVLRGEMSLVGPRPERPVFVHRFEERVADYYDRHRVKSGITGWAQVHGHRGDSPIEQRTRLDLFYVENWSLGLDLKIIAMTALAVFRHRGS
jgi:lipopolysaccharide/colanic/teichoic acid biosynthesis glycosyltransferase